jgi:hypothetical protein
MSPIAVTLSNSMVSNPSWKPLPSCSSGTNWKPLVKMSLIPAFGLSGSNAFT